MEKGKFYLTGLGLLMKDTRFTTQETATLNWLCAAAAESDAVYFDQISSVPPGSEVWHGIEQLKKTFRRLGKHEILQAHYDRAANLHGSVPSH